MLADLWLEARVIARSVFLESVRRRTLQVMLLISIALVSLFAWGVHELNTAIPPGVRDVGPLTVNAREFASVQLAGIAMFALFFIGAVLAVLLNQSAIRGDAEQGMLQQVVARPIGRTVLLVMRFAVVAALCAVYVSVIYAVMAVSLTYLGTWDPGSVVVPGAWLALAVVLVCALTVAVSVVLPATSTGIATFLVVGAGIGAGFFRELANTVGSGSLDAPTIIATWVLPFERCYQAAIAAISPTNADRAFTALGPLTSGRAADAWLVPWTIGWLVLVLGVASALFARRDL